MPDVWGFGEPKDSLQTYADGSTVPHRGWTVTLNGTVVGELETHMHKRKGPDGKTDVSFGITAIAFSVMREGGK